MKTRSWLASASTWLLACGFCLLVGLALPVGADSGLPLPPLNSASRAPRLPGKFVWADLVTDDVPAARNFYAGLFGWSFRDFGGYLVAYNDDRPLAGMFQRPRPKDQSAQPRWLGYISVPDVAQARRAVTAAGGEVVVEPRKFPKRGEQAVFLDADGALFGVVKSSGGDPADVLAEPGDWVWVQLLTRDARRAADFYRAVVGYSVVENSETNRASDFVLTSKGYARATVRALRGANRAMKPTWIPFVRVANLDDCLAKTTSLGGKVVVAPRPDVLGGKAALVADPTGGTVGVMELQPGLLKGGR